MNTVLFICILVFFGCIYLAIGKLTSGGAKSKEEYFLSGRRLNFFSLTMTLLATQIGGGALIGAAEEAYLRGWIGILYSLGLFFGFLLLAFGFASKLKNLQLCTVAEIFEKKYKSPFLRKFASILSIISLFFILVASGLAVRKFLISLGLDHTSLYLAFWAVVILYTVMGGLKAVVYTDVIQTIFFLVAVLLSFFVSLGSLPDLASFKSSTLFISEQSVPWTAWVLMPLLFVLTAQDMGQRCFAARSSRTVSMATTCSAFILLLFSLIPVYFGILARNLQLIVPEGGSVLLVAVEATTSPTILTLFACAVLMAIISTADSLLCSISSNLAFDFPKLASGDPEKSVLFSQVLTFFVGMLAVIFSFLFENVVPVMVGAYEMYICALFVPIFMALLVKNPSRNAAFCSILFGGVGFIFFRFFEAPFPKELFSLLLSFSGFLVGSFSEEINLHVFSLKKFNNLFTSSKRKSSLKIKVIK
jgi:solute:Na+ symporter, SSS family